MTKSQLEKLIDRYLKGDATEQEMNMVEQFYAHLVEGEERTKYLSTQDINQIKRRMHHQMKRRIQRSQREKMWYFLSAAAAVLVLLVSAYLYVFESAQEDPIVGVPDTETTVIAGPDQRSLLLSDGTYVLLSPGASISYPEAFDEMFRKVQLEGEAWFDVQRDTIHPFQVVSNEVTTTVLGTSFSINARSYSAEVEVKVTSGKVQVNTKEKELAILEKDDHLIYKSGEYEVSRNALKVETAEKLPEPGAFKLANVTMKDAAKFLEKRWNKEVTFENPTIQDCPLYASFNAHDSLEEVLMILCGVSNSKYKIENGKIKIYGKGCE